MKTWLQRLAIALGIVTVIALGVLYMAGRGSFGQHEAPGEVTRSERPAAVVDSTERAAKRGAARVGASWSKQILFGDLHAHTTFSADAFLLSLPARAGEGAHPPADACDFARFCSSLDFWSINDHAEGLSPRHWQETVDAIRQCNAVSGNAERPDTVAFLGWEWTQVGDTPDAHYGHKNVVLAHTDADRIPTRPIGAMRSMLRARRAADLPTLAAGAFALYAGHPRYHDLMRFVHERADLPLCDADANVRDLPPDCIENVESPVDLYRKLDEWGHDAIVIPHGTTWGYYTPPGSSWDKQLTGAFHDPARQTLFEIASGHGNAELHRAWRGVKLDADGRVSCPEPSPDYLPSCWRAGEIVEARCLGLELDAAECGRRAATARQHAAEAFGQGHLTVAEEQAGDWLDAGQCRDCPQPAFNYRPGGSAQYVSAISNFAEPEAPKRFRFGFIGSSDNHFARPGTGYKEVHRAGFTESRAGLEPEADVSAPEDRDPSKQAGLARSTPYDLAQNEGRIFELFEGERQASFFLTGGLAAVHATGRDRAAIWQAMEQREVYGTSGPRILLWFDLSNPPGKSGSVPMGGEVSMRAAPAFEVRAVGSFAQRPGCPDSTREALGPERLARICKNECYHPSDQRRPIARIEVVRIQPQQVAGEPVAPLIQDPWRRFECAPIPDGCSARFEDPDFARDGRDTLYYVRAIEAPAPAINALGIRCRRDDAGRCIEATLCGSDPEDPDCLGLHEPRAWSSPIFVDWRR